MNSPQVSVIIPCYRQAQYLPEAIASVLAQTYAHIEIVVVNDGSDDDTEAVAARYGDRIRYVYQQNGGLSSARNTGLGIATGYYVLFLDADDLLHPRAVEWLVRSARSKADCMYIMGFRTFLVNPDMEEEIEHLPSCNGIPFPRLIHSNPGPPNAYMTPRHVVEQVGGFNEHLKSCEDWDLWIRICIRGVPVVTVPHCGAYYRNVANSMSKNYVRMLETRTDVLLGAHAEIVERPALLESFGQELLAAEIRVLRRFLSWRLRGAHVGRLRTSIADLECRGFSVPRSQVKRHLGRLLGSRVEDLAIHYFRVCEPKTIARYRNHYC